MDKIYEQAKDLHVRAVYVYAKANDAYAYSDSSKTKKIDSATLENLFLMGAVIIDGDIKYKPVSYGVASTVGTITYVKTDTTTATTAVLATLKSKEYSV